MILQSKTEKNKIQSKIEKNKYAKKGAARRIDPGGSNGWDIWKDSFLKIAPLHMKCQWEVLTDLHLFCRFLTELFFCPFLIFVSCIWFQFYISIFLFALICIFTLIWEICRRDVLGNFCTWGWFSHLRGGWTGEGLTVIFALTFTVNSWWMVLQNSEYVV